MLHKEKPWACLSRISAGDFAGRAQGNSLSSYFAQLQPAHRQIRNKGAGNQLLGNRHTARSRMMIPDSSRRT